MKKEDILKMSRKENKNKDLAKIQIENEGVKYAAIAILILSTIYFCLEIFVQGKTNYGWYSLIALYCGVLYGYKGIKLKDKFNIFVALIWIFCSTMLIYNYISQIFAGSIL